MLGPVRMCFKIGSQNFLVYRKRRLNWDREIPPLWYRIKMKDYMLVFMAFELERIFMVQHLFHLQVYENYNEFDVLFYLCSSYI
jgi:hypothetical protein